LKSLRILELPSAEGSGREYEEVRIMRFLFEGLLIALGIAPAIIGK